MSDKTTTEADPNAAFAAQSQVRGPWRAYLDQLAPFRPELYRHCLSLTSNIWDAEDLAQDALMKVYSLLGKIDADLDNPKGYLIRTATNLWIDRVRRRAREVDMLALQAALPSDTEPADEVGVREAAQRLLGVLHPQERAAVVMKDLLGFSLAETASTLNTTVGAVKSALHRGRNRVEAGGAQVASDRALVERFMQALRDIDLDGLKAICQADLTVELVGGAEMDSFENSKMFFQHAHFVMPEIGFGENPHWALYDYEGETVVVGFRTLGGVEGINEIHRLEIADDKIRRVRCYCFCPDTLQALGDQLGLAALRRPYRSPS